MLGGHWIVEGHIYSLGGYWECLVCEHAFRTLKEFGELRCVRKPAKQA